VRKLSDDHDKKRIEVVIAKKPGINLPKRSAHPKAEICYLALSD
jgi:hypothetical protein